MSRVKLSFEQLTKKLDGYIVHLHRTSRTVDGTAEKVAEVANNMGMCGWYLVGIKQVTRTTQKVKGNYGKR